jgi:hypothetical protein
MTTIGLLKIMQRNVLNMKGSTPYFHSDPT